MVTGTVRMISWSVNNTHTHLSVITVLDQRQEQHEQTHNHTRKRKMNEHDRKKHRNHNTTMLTLSAIPRGTSGTPSMRALMRSQHSNARVGRHTKGHERHTQHESVDDEDGNAHHRNKEHGNPQSSSTNTTSSDAQAHERQCSQ